MVNIDYVTVGIRGNAADTTCDPVGYCSLENVMAAAGFRARWETRWAQNPPHPPSRVRWLPEYENRVHQKTGLGRGNLEMTARLQQANLPRRIQ